MKRLCQTFSIAILVSLSAFVVAPTGPGAKASGVQTGQVAAKPNVIYILADDLGYGDLGCYGQKLIQTSNLDRMAREGMRFTKMYAGSTVCAPSRAVLMTGKHMGHVSMRQRNARPDQRSGFAERRKDDCLCLQKRRLQNGALRQMGPRRNRFRRASEPDGL